MKTELNYSITEMGNISKVLDIYNIEPKILDTLSEKNFAELNNYDYIDILALNEAEFISREYSIPNEKDHDLFGTYIYIKIFISGKSNYIRLKDCQDWENIREDIMKQIEIRKDKDNKIERISKTEFNNLVKLLDEEDIDIKFLTDLLNNRTILANGKEFLKIISFNELEQIATCYSIVIEEEDHDLFTTCKYLKLYLNSTYVYFRLSDGKDWKQISASIKSKIDNRRQERELDNRKKYLDDLILKYVAIEEIN